MSPYDSDSSDGDDEDYTETGVLLGYASKEPTEDDISQLGGYPVREGTHPSDRPVLANNQSDMARSHHSSTSPIRKMQSLQ